MRQTLLIVESDDESRGLYRWFLTECGYAVEICDDSMDCVMKLSRIMPAAVVLDLELRQGSADCVLSWLREHGLAREIPVILTASARNPHDVANMISPPVVSFLPKPFTLAVLMDRIRSAIATNAPEGSLPRGGA